MGTVHSKWSGMRSIFCCGVRVFGRGEESDKELHE